MSRGSTWNPCKTEINFYFAWMKLTMYLDTVIVDAILVVPDPWIR